MKKHLLKITTIALLSIFNIHFSVSVAQEMTVQAPKSVFLGDNFTVQFIVNDNAENFRGPSFKGFSLRSGPNPNKMRYTTNINGKITNTLQNTFSYTLTADQEGTFTVSPATCTSNGKKLSSNSFTIKVIKPTAAQQQQRQQQQQRRRAAFDPFGMFDPWDQQQQTQPQEAPKIEDNALFARASVSKTNPYQGEQIIVTYKIYTQVPVRQFAIDKLPGNKGFWAEDLTASGQQVRQHEEIIDGRLYQVAEIRRGALFPQQSGNLSVEPLDLNVLAIVHNQRRRTGTLLDLFDDPFFNTAQAVEHPLHTRRINVSVKPLPTPPDDFSGAVGNFSITGGLSHSNVKAGEAITYHISVSGRGNLMLITPPTPDFPSSFETYDPQVKDNITRGDNGISGSRTYEWVLIPREDGTFTIPAYKFIYFDPSSGQYKTSTIDAQTISILPGSNQPAKQQTDPTAKQTSHWSTYILYTLSALAIIFIVLFIVFWIIKKHHSREIDMVARRKRNALRIAQRRLKKASSHMKVGETEPFYLEIYHALWGCLSDKYSIPTSTLNRDTVTDCLVDKQVPEAQQHLILQLLNEVDIARFAPGNPEVQMHHIYQQALDVISEI